MVASGDITDRDTAERVIDATGAAAVMVGRGAQGRPWALREMAGEGGADADAAEVVAELIRFMREVEREMGERAVGFLRKFYGWYLRGTPGAKTIRGALMACATVAAAERELLGFCPEARRCSPRTRPSSTSFPTPAPTGCWSCRSRSTAAAEPLSAQTRSVSEPAHRLRTLGEHERTEGRKTGWRRLAPVADEEPRQTGQDPPSWDTAATTGAPRRSSSAARTSAGMSAQPSRTPEAAGNDGGGGAST